MNDICFIDTETTGLDPERHVPWEIGLVIDDAEYCWFVLPDPDEMGRADPTALRLTDYHERAAVAEKTGWTPTERQGFVSWERRYRFATYLARLIGKRHLAGNVVSFDARMVGDFLRHSGAAPAWHYHLIDCECVAAGRLGQAPPWKSEDLSRALGIDPDHYERHTALGDALWARDMYEAAMAR